MHLRLPPANHLPPDLSATITKFCTHTRRNTSTAGSCANHPGQAGS